MALTVQLSFLIACVVFPCCLAQVCPPGFSSLGAGCYLYISSPLQWPVAAMRCQESHPNAHLVFINTVDEQNVIAGLGQYYGGANMWYGGQRISSPDSGSRDFVWKTTVSTQSDSTMKRLAFTMWQSGQPDNAGTGESCIYGGGAASYHWFDANCNSQMASMCEVDI